MADDTGFSTRRLPAGRRVAGWAEAVSDRFVESSFDVLDADGFDASMLHRDLPELAVTRIRSAGHYRKRVSHSRAQAAQDAEAFYLVSLQLEGRCSVAQGGRDAQLAPGQYAIYDTRQPYELVLEDDYQQAVLRIPRRALQARLPGADALLARAVAADALPARLLTQMVREVCTAPLQPAAADDVASALIGVLAGGLRTLAGDAAPPRTAPAQRRRVKAYVAAHLHEPDLDVARIAAALGVSASWLHKLFVAEGTTLTRFVWAQRLEACRGALADPRAAALPITQIAHDCGFSDAAHFSRSFRQRFGITPRAFRTVARSPDGKRMTADDALEPKP
jgi:AraC-like DNA-binding protein